MRAYEACKKRDPSRLAINLTLGVSPSWRNMNADGENLGKDDIKLVLQYVTVILKFECSHQYAKDILNVYKC